MKQRIGYITLLWLFTGLAYGSVLQSQLNQAIHQHLDPILEKMVQEQGSGRYQLDISPLLLQGVAPCPNPVKVEPMLGSKAPLGHFTVRLICQSPQTHWQLFSRVNAHIYARVVVSNASLHRQHKLILSDLGYRTQDLSTLYAGYYSARKPLLGMVVRRPLPPGQVITPVSVMRGAMIERGEHINIIAQSGNLKITAPGMALQSGKLHQQIRVRNLSSHKQIWAEVINHHQVQTHF
ncbi:flagellar basal body P-ring formation chaperone FlgA [Dongshaea marina]|uniref:flagellar basal body P-ring formation chaperone FlgA n=1 Tax=Dongshaea marina TaxID=2047966 RepID=UPI00131F30BC|nr:flagellar basal body P-ring formation chaperone FlgA [Dongshaea marina]